MPETAHLIEDPLYYDSSAPHAVFCHMVARIEGVDLFNFAHFPKKLNAAGKERFRHMASILGLEFDGRPGCWRPGQSGNPHGSTANWPAEADEIIHALYVQGVGVIKIAQEIYRATGFLRSGNAVNFRRRKLNLPDIPMSAWTDERTARGIALWNEGQSAGKIAIILNDEFGTSFSRNAVIGKSHRDEWPKRITAVRRTYQRRRDPSKSTREYINAKQRGAYARKPRPERIIVPVDYGEQLDRQIPIERRKTFFDLAPRECKWCVGDPRKTDHFFCGALRDGESPYCVDHSKRAFRAAA